MNLLAPGKYERVSAHFTRIARIRLESGDAGRNLKFVVAVSREAETHCLNRYPSPKGRTGCPQGRPPRFFFGPSKCCAMWRSGADHAGLSRKRFANAPKLAIPLGIRTITERGKPTCKEQICFGSRPSHRSGSRQPAVTRLWNKGSWARARGLLPRCCSTVMSSPGWRSALRPTWPTARSSRRAAERRRDLTAQISGAFGPTSLFRAIAGHCPGGGLLRFGMPVANTGSNDGRDGTCSRKS